MCGQLSRVSHRQIFRSTLSDDEILMQIYYLFSEENDIIILSLVRSNEEGNIGFLKTDNRICVAVSRAK